VAQIGRLKRRERGVPQASGGSYQSWPTRAEVRALRAGRGPLIRFADLTQMLR